MNFSRQRAAVVCLLLVVAASLVVPARGAGVTLITHGLQSSSGEPAWVVAMGNAIAARSTTPAAIIRMEVGHVSGNTLGVLQFTLESGTLPTTNSTNAEVVIRLNWSSVSGPFASENATDIANQLMPYLLLPVNWGGQFVTAPFAELPIHLVGHSRGASVISEISRLLAQQGVWVDQLTPLDAHPLTSADPFTIPRDPSVVMWDNVIFADNYYETESYPAGEPLAGTTQLFLNARFEADNISGDGSLGVDHTQVHDWYHGTIDTNATNVAGDPIPRAYWYFPGDVGFQYSRLAGGTYSGGTRATNNAGLRFAGATRTLVTRTVTGSNVWDNVAIGNLPGDTNIVQGATIQADVYFEDTNYDGTLRVGLDNDGNPYNVAAGPPFYTTNTSALSGSLVQILFDSTSTPPGQYRLYASVSNSVHVRRFVTRGRVNVLQRVGPTLLAPATLTNDVVQISLMGQTGGAYVLLSSSNLVSWTPLATNVLVSNLWQYLDTPPPGPRYYRAYLKAQ